jgi:hypothetical protein
MQELIYNLGKERLNTEPKIRVNRHILNIGNGVIDDNSSDIIELAKKKFKEVCELDLFDYEMEVIERINPVGFYLNWHIDDCSIHKHKSTDGKFNNEPLNEKFSLYHEKKLPVFSMVIYLSEDFTGGEFEFVDMVIKPKKYDVIIFDSREVHRVRRLRNGFRKNILVKFFCKK